MRKPHDCPRCPGLGTVGSEGRYLIGVQRAVAIQVEHVVHDVQLPPTPSTADASNIPTKMVIFPHASLLCGSKLGGGSERRLTASPLRAAAWPRW
jgi:hypothetical protein